MLKSSFSPIVFLLKPGVFIEKFGHSQQTVVRQNGNIWKGGLLITGHFGAVEFLPGVLAANEYEVAIITRFKTRKLKEALAKVVSYYDILTIDADEGSTFVRGMKALRDGRVLITLCDEFNYWKPHRGKEVNVFGTIVPQDKTLDVLYKRAKAPVCLGLLARLGSKYTLILEHIAQQCCPKQAEMLFLVVDISNSYAG